MLVVVDFSEGLGASLEKIMGVGVKRKYCICSAEYVHLTSKNHDFVDTE